MGVRRRIDDSAGREAVRAWLREFEAHRPDSTQPPARGGAGPESAADGPLRQERTADEVLAAAEAVALPRTVLATAVRYALEELSEIAEGNSVEVRVPPFGVAQCVPGPRHTRGTPPNVVEMKAGVWLALATGRADWDDAVAAGRVSASGVRADLAEALPRLTRISRA
ncbi:sterol carrier family protein [Zhihengliuella sp.]|uniref:sterol carrier family protein n=1 Tax=Zhihengliuella sp. TaxID=1954483 RepID=UPI0035C24AEC